MIRILIVFAVASVCKADINLFVVGGSSSDISKVPYQAALLYHNTLTCGGSIISKNFILTAAHCLLVSNNLKDYTVRVGSSYSDKGGTVMKVAKITVHPDFENPPLKNDFALLQLKTPIKEFGRKIKSIALPSPNQKLVSGSPAVISGWGRLRQFGELPRKMQIAVVPLVDWEDCHIRYDGIITEEMRCAGIGGDQDSCEGEPNLISYSNYLS
jgi:trypsin